MYHQKPVQEGPKPYTPPVLVYKKKGDEAEADIRRAQEAKKSLWLSCMPDLCTFSIKKLNVVCVVSNPCSYKRRYQLANEFIDRMEANQHVVLYVVELTYKDQPFMITSSSNSRHLQIRTDAAPIWMKENLINVGIKNLLPKDWESVAFIDADVEFENVRWAEETMKLLQGYDVVQLFSHANDMDFNQDSMNMFISFGYQYAHNREYIAGAKLNKYWHPGFGYAMRRKFYDKIGGIFDAGILGSGDHHMSMAFIGLGKHSVHTQAHDSYRKILAEFEKKAEGCRLGYCPGIIKHYYHGSKQNRKYWDRWQILIKHKYDPYKHIEYNDIGLMVPSKDCPQEMLKDIMSYFEERKEDDEN